MKNFTNAFQNNCFYQIARKSMKKASIHFSVVLNGEFAITKISAERLFFSADLCYNDMGDENG